MTHFDDVMNKIWCASANNIVVDVEYERVFNISCLNGYTEIAKFVFLLCIASHMNILVKNATKRKGTHSNTPSGSLNQVIPLAMKSLPENIRPVFTVLFEQSTQNMDYIKQQLQDIQATLATTNKRWWMIKHYSFILFFFFFLTSTFIISFCIEFVLFLFNFYLKKQCVIHDTFINNK